MSDSENTNISPEPLPLDEQLRHPFVVELQRRNLQVQPEYLGVGRQLLCGLQVQLRSCTITFNITDQAEIFLTDFRRISDAQSMLSPLRELVDFLALAADERFGIKGGVAKVKPRGQRTGDLKLQRLTQAYKRLTNFDELGRDSRGFLWIGRNSRDFLNDIRRKNHHGN